MHWTVGSRQKLTQKTQRKSCLFVIYVEVMHCTSWKKGTTVRQNTLVHLNFQVAQDFTDKEARQ